TDARDLAAWLTDNTRRRIPGVVNVPGPEGTTFGDLLTACAQVTAPQRGDGLELRPTADPVLLGAGVEPWMELPMWAPDTPEFAGHRGVPGGGGAPARAALPPAHGPPPRPLDRADGGGAQQGPPGLEIRGEARDRL